MAPAVTSRREIRERGGGWAGRRAWGTGRFGGCEARGVACVVEGRLGGRRRFFVLATGR